MGDTVHIREVIADLEAWQIIDVRSPGEYTAGHIPGATSIPLFTDEERASIGTIYTQISPEEAFTEGLRISGAKMTGLVEAVQPYRNIPGKKILIHCWRGGKRSQAVQWLFNFSGTQVHRLDGGYKSFRNALTTFFNYNPFTLKILGGCTGAGKTEILEAMSHQGAQVIDLEKMAHHKGSAFGSIGEPNQPTTEQFENNLFYAFSELDTSMPVWLENESKSIGKAHLPDGLWNQMRDSILYTIDVDRDCRLDRVLSYYAEPINVALLKVSFEKIQKRLGGLDYRNSIKALETGDLRTAASLALVYYDKAYTFQLDNWPQDKVYHLEACEQVEKTAKRLLNL
ncbi:MAG: tRNA 2-selenouridine(34) synthase MnmH [Saprospiraceae bacterium]|nr:tRNA 2-selenouridine(34) synthase MnmH [Saprospiraceae bacterium]